MLKIERQTKSFLRLEEPTLAGASITERYDLQEFIVTDPALNGCNVSDLYASNKAWRESIRGSCLKRR